MRYWGVKMVSPSCSRLGVAVRFGCVVTLMVGGAFADPVELRVQGYAQMQMHMLDGTTGQQCRVHFDLTVIECGWQLRFLRAPPPGSPVARDSETVTFDGTNLYYMVDIRSAIDRQKTLGQVFDAPNTAYGRAFGAVFKRATFQSGPRMRLQSNPGVCLALWLNECDLRFASFRGQLQLRRMPRFHGPGSATSQPSTLDKCPLLVEACGIECQPQTRPRKGQGSRSSSCWR